MCHLGYQPVSRRGTLESQAMPRKPPDRQLSTSITYCMTSAEGLDIEECEDFVGFEELEGGDVACDVVSLRCSEL